MDGKPCSRRQLTKEERIANYRISRERRAVENVFGILVSRFRVLLGKMEQRPKVVRDIVLTCVVLHNRLRKHQGGEDRASTPVDDIASLQSEQVVYVPYKMNRWCMYQMTTTGILQKTYLNHLGALSGQEDRI